MGPLKRAEPFVMGGRLDFQLGDWHWYECQFPSATEIPAPCYRASILIRLNYTPIGALMRITGERKIYTPLVSLFAFPRVNLSRKKRQTNERKTNWKYWNWIKIFRGEIDTVFPFRYSFFCKSPLKRSDYTPEITFQLCFMKNCLIQKYSSLFLVKLNYTFLFYHKSKEYSILSKKNMYPSIEHNN